jgi:hypothetical protein
MQQAVLLVVVPQHLEVVLIWFVEVAQGRRGSSRSSSGRCTAAAGGDGPVMVMAVMDQCSTKGACATPLVCEACRSAASSGAGAVR